MHVKARQGGTAVRVLGRGREHRRKGGRGASAVVAAVVVLAVMALAAASASASPLSVKKVESGDLPQLRAPVGLHQLDSGALRSLLAGASSASPALPGSPSALGAGDIFYDGFEGSVGHWSLAGDPTWGFWKSRPAVGAWSAYCAGSTVAPPGPYVNNMIAVMMTGQIDLSGMTSARLDYKLYFVTEREYDFVRVWVSADGFETYGGYRYSGNSQGWIDDFIDLEDVPGLGSVCGQSNVSIAFLFDSDATNVAEGAYVDEVRVSNPPKPVVVTMTASPRTVGYNKPVSIAGSLTTGSGAPLPNRPVDLYTSLNGTDFDYQSTLSSVTGGYATTVRIVRRTYFWLWFEGDSAYEKGSSEIVKVMACAKLTPPAFGKTVPRGVLVTKWGTLLPKHSLAACRGSTTIKFYRYSNRKWRLVGVSDAKSYKNTTSATKYSVRFRYGTASKWRVRAFHEDLDHARTVSAWKYFRVL